MTMPLSILLAAFVLGASTAEEPVRIFAASSLTDALSDALTRFGRDHPGTRIVPQFGSSSDLARQILAGAPADLFFSADEPQMARLGVEARANVLSNQLVVVRERAHSESLSSLADLVKLERIAMADPAAVPAGVYARRCLEERGLWSRIRPKVVPTLDVRGALAAVASGNVDAGVVYRTDAAIEHRVAVVYEVARTEGPEIVYPLAILEGRARAEVRALYTFLRSSAAAEVFRKHGFIVFEERAP